jgi:lysyl-tRNA synthetase class 1
MASSRRSTRTTGASLRILDGHVKVGWKVDWALRWYAYNVDYEMYGKDLIDSARLSGRITRLMGKQPPVGSFYELFLDEEGRKISKSVGEGLTVDTWTNYAPLESLLHYLFQNPQRAKRLFWDVVPKSVDEYLEELRRYPTVEPDQQPDLAVWHIFDRGRHVPPYETGINFSLINNLVSALGTDDVPLTLQYLEQYDPMAKQHRAFLENLVHKSSHYYRDFILPEKAYRPPTAEEATWLRHLRDKVAAYQGNDEGELQAMPFNLAREFEVKPNLIFQAFYQVLLGQERGPRFGTFARLLGQERLLALFDAALEPTKDALP